MKPSSSATPASPFGCLLFRFFAIRLTSLGQPLHEGVDPCLLTTNYASNSILRNIKLMQLDNQEPFKEIGNAVRPCLSFLGQRYLLVRRSYRQSRLTTGGSAASAQRESAAAAG